PQRILYLGKTARDGTIHRRLALGANARDGLDGIEVAAGRFGGEARSEAIFSTIDSDKKPINAALSCHHRGMMRVMQSTASVDSTAPSNVAAMSADIAAMLRAKDEQIAALQQQIEWFRR